MHHLPIIVGSDYYAVPNELHYKCYLGYILYIDDHFLKSWILLVNVMYLLISFLVIVRISYFEVVEAQCYSSSGKLRPSDQVNDYHQN